MNLPPDLVQALATATRQWHAASRHYETASRLFADAQTQLAHAERDLHELARAVELATGKPGAAAELVSTLAAQAPQTVTMPIAPAVPVAAVPAGQSVGPAPADGLDAGAEVLRLMQAQRMGM